MPLIREHGVRLAALVSIPFFLAITPPKAYGNSFSLSNLLERAKVYDPIYQSAIADSSASQTATTQGRSALLPRLNASALLQQVDAKRTAFGQSTSASSSPFGFTLTLNQPLFRLQAWENYKQSELVSALGQLQASTAEQDLILRLVQSYFETLAARDTLETIQAQKKAIALQLESAQRNFEIGTTTVTDQQEAQARFDLIQARELAATNQFNLAKLRLQNVIGPDEVPLLGLPQNLRITSPTPNNPADWAKQAIKSNLSYQQSEVKFEIAKREVKKQRYGHLPTLDLQAEYLDGEQQQFDNTTGQPFDAEQKSTTVSLILSIPVFSGGLTQSQTAESEYLLSKAKAEKDLSRQTVEVQARSSYLSVQTGLSQIQALQTAVESSKLALQANQTGYEIGVRINIDVLNAQQQVSSAQRELLQAQYDTLLNLLRLDAAAGQLSKQSLEKIDQLLTQQLH